MKKLAMFVGGTALAAGVVLVPVGAASAAATHSSTTAVRATHVSPRDVIPAEVCYAGDGYVAYDEYSPTGYVCVGGWYNGVPVWY